MYILAQHYFLENEFSNTTTLCERTVYETQFTYLSIRM